MSFIEQQVIEFVSGPLDGLVGVFPLPTESMLIVKTQEIHEHWFTRLVRSLKVQGTSSTFVVAIYELNLRNEQPVYEYVSSQIALEQSLDRRALWVLLDDERLVATLPAAKRKG